MRARGSACGGRISAALAAAALAAACAFAGAFPCAAHAAPAVSADYPLAIDATTAKEGENVVSVMVPSSVSIAIKTSIVDGRIIGFIGGSAEVTNSPHSYAPISLSVASVDDAPQGGQSFLRYVDMALRGHHDCALVEGDGQSLPLFDGIEPGSSETFEAFIAQKRDDVLVPAGSYLVRTTLLVQPDELG